MGQPLRGSSRANRAEVDPEARSVALCGNFVDDADVTGLDVMPKSQMQKGMILHTNKALRSFDYIPVIHQLKLH